MARPLPVLLVPALVALAAGPAAHAVFLPGTKTLLGQDLDILPLGLVPWGEDQLFVLDASPGCDRCLDPTARVLCRHQPARLVHVRRGAHAWTASRLDYELPASALWLGAGPGRSLVVGTTELILRLYLARHGDGWRVARAETVFEWPQMQALGPAGHGFENFVAEPDGALVFGLGRGVARFRPGRGRPGELEWLLEPPAKSAQPGAGPSLKELWTGKGMLVACTGDRILALDRRSRAVFGIDRKTRRKELLFLARQWPRPDFEPTSIQACGQALYVAGEVAGAAGARTYLVALAPAAGGGFQVTEPQMEILRAAPFALTPAGHLLIADPVHQRFWHIENVRVAPAETKAEAKDEGAGGEAAARADAAYRDLLKDLDAEAGAAGCDTAMVKAGAEGGKDSRAGTVGAGGSQPGTGAAAGFPAGAGAASGSQAGRRAVAAHAPAVPAGDQAGTDAAPDDEAAGWTRVAERKRPAPVEGKRLWPAGDKPWRLPVGQVNQRTIAARTHDLADGSGFTQAFAGWADRARREATGRSMGHRVATADRRRWLEPPTDLPRGLDAFTLSETALRRAARWLLLEAARANPRDEVAAWRARTIPGLPLFSFGLYEHGRRPEVILEVAELRAFAEAMDDLPGPGSLSGEMAAMDGITGVHRTRDGLAWITYGLAVALDTAPGGSLSVRPGGARAAIHDWTGEEAGAAPAATSVTAAAGPGAAASGPEAKPAPADAGAAAAGAGPRKPFKLNPLAKEFVMPGIPAGAKP